MNISMKKIRCCMIAYMEAEKRKTKSLEDFLKKSQRVVKEIIVHRV